MEEETDRGGRGVGWKRNRWVVEKVLDGRGNP